MGLHRCQVLSFLRDGGYSVIFLLETHRDPAADASWQLEWRDKVYFSHLTVRTAGVATLFSPNLRPEVLEAPTSGPERLRFYQQASTFFGSLDPRECLVLGGDFNTTLEEQDHSGIESSQAAVGVLREIVDHHSVVDVWHGHHPEGNTTFTYV
ncbi:unnamed protein product [Caretta caretta]